jgi:acetyltransferase-like isoleucine patch superfamily enzyme
MSCLDTRDQGPASHPFPMHSAELFTVMQVSFSLGKPVEGTDMSSLFFERLINKARRLLTGKSPRIVRAIRGKGNVVDADGATLSGVELDIVGDDNHISIGRGSVLTNVRFRMRGSGHRIIFGEKCRISRGALLWFEDDGCLLQVGAATTMVEVHVAVTEAGSKVTIGEDCMFANDIDIRSGDTHSIVDSKSGRRLNFAADILVGDHVWIAPHAIVLKGVNIGANSIVASGAVVTKSFGSGVIIGGNPAQVIKTGVSWQRDRLPREL